MRRIVLTLGIVVAVVWAMPTALAQGNGAGIAGSPHDFSSFDFNFREEIRESLEEAGYETPTPIQTQAMPIVLSGQDLIGVAETGTGKTLAFLLPLFQNLRPDESDPQGLVICPTRWSPSRRSRSR